MADFQTNKDKYKIKFLYNESFLKIIIKDEELKGKNKFKFAPVHLAFRNSLKNYFSNFKDLINQIKQKQILIEIKNPSTVKSSLKDIRTKFLNLIMFYKEDNKNKIIITQKINMLNIEYYLTYGANYKMISNI